MSIEKIENKYLTNLTRTLMGQLGINVKNLDLTATKTTTLDHRISFFCSQYKDDICTKVSKFRPEIKGRIACCDPEFRGTIFEITQSIMFRQVQALIKQDIKNLKPRKETWSRKICQFKVSVLNFKLLPDNQAEFTISVSNVITDEIVIAKAKINSEYVTSVVGATKRFYEYLEKDSFAKIFLIKMSDTTDEMLHNKETQHLQISPNIRAEATSTSVHVMVDTRYSDEIFNISL